MQYLDDLKVKLTELSTVLSEIDDLESRKAVIRSQIEKWMKLNETEVYELYDNNNQIWKIYKSVTVRNSVSDYMILKDVLGKENAHLVVEKEIPMLNIRKAKKFSPEWLDKR